MIERGITGLRTLRCVPCVDLESCDAHVSLLPRHAFCLRSSLHSPLSQVLMQAMFDIPDEPQVTAIVVDHEAVHSRKVRLLHEPMTLSKYLAEMQGEHPHHGMAPVEGDGLEDDHHGHQHQQPQSMVGGV